MEPRLEFDDFQATAGTSMDEGLVLYDNIQMNGFVQNNRGDRDNGYRLLTKSTSFDCEQSLVSKRVEALRQSSTADALYSVIQKKNFGRLDEVRDPIFSPPPCLDGFDRLPSFGALRRNDTQSGGASTEGREYDSLKFFHISPLVRDQLQG